MVKIKGKLNTKELDPLAEAGLADAGAVKKEEEKPVSAQMKTVSYEPARHKFPHMALFIVAIVLVFGGIGASIYFGAWEAGDIDIYDLTAKTVIVNINSQPQTVATNAETIDDLLKDLDIHIGADDYIDKKMDQPIVDGMKIWLRLSVPIRVVADGQVYSFESQPITVQKALDINGITLGENDLVSQPLLSYIYTGTEIEVYRVEKTTETVDEYIEQPESTVEYSYLAAGARAVITEGSPGINRNTYDVTYKDGEEIERTLLSTEKVRDPVERVVGIGPENSTGTATKAMAMTSEGAAFYYETSYTMEATAYTWTGYRTATGTWPKVGTIAVDPDIIPLGTKVYVAGYGFAVAEDTGGAIDNYIIDLYMDTESACVVWGRRQVTVYILE